MKVWLDDLRPPERYGRLGWTWAKTFDEAIELLKTGAVTEASLDHDLSVNASLGMPVEGEKTGYDVVLWMAANEVWPAKVTVHTLNVAGRDRMLRVIEQHCRCVVEPAAM